MKIALPKLSSVPLSGPLIQGFIINLIDVWPPVFNILYPDKFAGVGNLPGLNLLTLIS